MKFGFTKEEAEDWLEHEPSFTPSRRKVTDFKSNEEGTEPEKQWFK